MKMLEDLWIEKLEKHNQYSHVEILQIIILSSHRQTKQVNILCLTEYNDINKLLVIKK